MDWQLSGGLSKGKKIYVGLPVQRCVSCKFGKEKVSGAWFLDVCGLHFKTCFKTQLSHLIS